MTEFKTFSLPDIYLAAEQAKGMQQRNALFGMQKDQMTADNEVRDVLRLGRFSNDIINSPNPVETYNTMLPDIRRVITSKALLERLNPTNNADEIVSEAQQLLSLSQKLSSQPEIQRILETEGANGPEFTAVLETGDTKPLGVRPATSPNKAPETRNRYEGETVIQEQWNPETRQYEEVGRGPRYKQDTNITQIVNPILMKLANGQPVSEGEQRVLDIYTRADYLDRLIRGAYEGGGASPTGSPPPSGPRPGLEPVSATEAHSAPSSIPPRQPGTGRDKPKSQILAEAWDAIDRGADRQAVEERLREMGIEPMLLNAARGKIKRNNQ